MKKLLSDYGMILVLIALLMGLEYSVPLLVKSVFEHPLSFVGLPVLCAPVHGIGAMPHGVQIIAAPDNDALALRAGAYLEAAGVCTAPIAG